MKTPEKLPSSSKAHTTKFEDASGPIPDDAFENDFGDPRPPALSPEELEDFRAETAAQLERIKNLLRKGEA